MGASEDKNLIWDEAVPPAMDRVEIGGVFEMKGYNWVRISQYQYQLTDESQEAYIFDAEDNITAKLKKVTKKMDALDKDYQRGHVKDQEYYLEGRKLAAEESRLTDLLRDLTIYARTVYTVKPPTIA